MLSRPQNARTHAITSTAHQTSLALYEHATILPQPYFSTHLYANFQMFSSFSRVVTYKLVYDANDYNSRKNELKAIVTHSSSYV